MTHLTLPRLLPSVDPEVFICFANARDARNRSHAVFALVSLNNSGELKLENSWQVLVNPGLPGHFDESGLTISDVRPRGSGYECLTFGWRLRYGGGWFNEIGNVLLDANLQVLSRTAAPFMSRTSIDPISLAYASFGIDSEILYCAPSGLSEETGTPLDFRILRRDLTGVRRVLADPEGIRSPGVFAYTRPWALLHNGVSHLWFCARGDKYRIMHTRRDESDPNKLSIPPTDDLVGLSNVREGGAVCYPSVSIVGDLAVLLYNGAGYGATGIGVAIRGAGSMSS